MSDFEKIFKAYDVRGIYPSEIDEATIHRIGEAYAVVMEPKRVVVGRDVRTSGKKLQQELISSLLESGINVVAIGTITTDQLYFAAGNYGLDGGISITASQGI
jgi:phosphomannomutase